MVVDLIFRSNDLCQFRVVDVLRMASPVVARTSARWRSSAIAIMPITRRLMECYYSIQDRRHATLLSTCPVWVAHNREGPAGRDRRPRE